MKTLIFKSLKAGILIGIGCIAYVVIPNHILGAFLFSLGLLTICIQRYTLFTGKIGSIPNKNVYADVKSLLIMLFFNVISIWGLCYLFSRFSGIDFSFANTLIDNKAKESWYECLLRSIGCGIMMEVAVSGFFTRKDENPITVIMPVMVFILCGFEHCIANVGYMALSGTYLILPFLLMVIGNGIGSCLISKFNYRNF